MYRFVVEGTYRSRPGSLAKSFFDLLGAETGYSVESEPFSLPGITALSCGIAARKRGQKYALAAIILGVVSIIPGIAITFVGMG